MHRSGSGIFRVSCMTVLWVAGCVMNEQPPKRDALSPTEVLVKDVGCSDVFEDYAVGIEGRVSDKWVAAIRLADTPGAEQLVMDEWDHMNPVGRIYGAIVLEMAVPAKAEAYWAQLFKSGQNVQYVTGDIVRKVSVREIARQVRAEMHGAEWQAVEQGLRRQMAPHGPTSTVAGDRR